MDQTVDEGPRHVITGPGTRSGPVSDMHAARAVYIISAPPPCEPMSRQPPRGRAVGTQTLRIQSAVWAKDAARRRCSSTSSSHSAIACVIADIHWSRSAMPMRYGR